MNPSTPHPVPSSPSVAPGDRAIEKGRSFSELSPQEQDLMVNGPRVSAAYVAASVVLWAAYLAFLIAVARPYMTF